MHLKPECNRLLLLGIKVKVGTPHTSAAEKMGQQAI